MPRRAATDQSQRPKVAKWVQQGREVVVCVDGPLAGRWYFVEDWRARVDAARYMVEKGSAPASCLHYRLTAEELLHPKEPATGRVLRWAGPTEQGR
jgi:hypothetical protein